MFLLFENATLALLGTTAVVAITHALLGIDHSLPFIALGRSRQWSLGYTIVVTTLCGIGHVASSVAIGGVGSLLGANLDSLMWVESTRGVVAAILLIGFGLAYTAWAVRNTFRDETQSHVHTHIDGTEYENLSLYHGDHLRLQSPGASVTPWALFIVFLFGPCEPLIPLMIAPAIAGSWMLLVAVVVTFGVLTVLVMGLTVTIGYRLLDVVPRHRFRRMADAVTGLLVAASGVGVLFLGL
jgi:sulfite exporter TauE/SafE